MSDSVRYAKWLLSFDFDGTLHDPASTPPVPPEFFKRLACLIDERDLVWGINTGRSLEYALEGLRESGFPIAPDWIVAREREIHRPDSTGGWRGHEPWNQRCVRDIDELFELEREFLTGIRAEILEHTGAEWLTMVGEPAGVIARTEEEMEWIVSRVQELVDPRSAISWQRNTIYLRFSHGDYHKGSSLTEVAGMFGVPAECCFAIGDSHNDIEMLDVKHAGMIACPANALEVVRERVGKLGGFVATGVHAHGAIEALDHYFA